MISVFFQKFQRLVLAFFLVSCLGVTTLQATEKQQVYNLGDCWVEPKAPSFHQIEECYTNTSSYSTQPKPQKAVLSGCGGGVRGLIQTVIAAEIENLTKYPICELFDEIYGVSTGGLGATFSVVPESQGSTKPKYSATQGMELFETLSDVAFGTKNYYDLLNPYGVRGPIYNPKPLEDILKEKIGDISFDELLVETTILTYNYGKDDGGVGVGFNSKIAKFLKKKYKARDILMATTRCPTYFSTFEIDNEPHADGGLYANDPTHFAFFKIFQEEKMIPYVVTLGTGKVEKKGLTQKETSTRGTVGWVSDLLDTFLKNNALTKVTNDFIEMFSPNIPNGQKNHSLFNPIIPSKNSAMDNGSKENMKELKDIALTYVKENTNQIKETCERLLKIKKDKKEYAEIMKDKIEDKSK